MIATHESLANVRSLMSTKDPDGVQEDMAKREVTAPACRSLKKMRCRRCDICLKVDFEINDPFG